MMIDTTTTTPAADRILEADSRETRRLAWRSALAGVILQVSVLSGLVSAFALSAVVPAHMAAGLERNGPLIAAVLLLFWCALGGATWGRALASITGVMERRRLTWTGALVYGPVTVITVFLLSLAERYFVEGAGRNLAPVHVTFAILFTLSAGLVSALLGGSVGLALRKGVLAGKLALYAGLTGGAVFLLADIVQDLLGRRVGGPNAAATATMITVMFAGNILASAATSVVIGLMLKRHRRLGSAIDLQDNYK